MLSRPHAYEPPAVIWVRVFPASTPLVSTATGTLELLVLPSPSPPAPL